MGIQKTTEGVVIHSTMVDDPKSGWGFIEPADGSGKVWFGTHSAQGIVFEKGDVVEFLYQKEPRFKDRPSAFRVYMKVKLLAGELET